jgi:hypothetical protein
VQISIYIFEYCFMKNRGKETQSGPLARMALRAAAKVRSKKV